MRAIIQRVSEASVEVAGETIGSIGPGLVVLVGVGQGDGVSECEALASRVVNLRIFSDEGGKFNRSALDIGGEILVVSQFTLHADTRKGRRPNFMAAARPEQAEPLIGHLIAQMRSHGLHVACGQFGAHMLVKIFNDGPVTIWLES